MNPLTLLASVLLALLYTAASGQKSDTLHWKENKPLQWSDFKAKPKSGLTGEAFCNLEANYEKPNPLKKTKFKIYAVWDKGKSWIAPSSRTEDELRYYQVLFDIYEVQARRLRKEFSEARLGLDPEAEFRRRYNLASEALRQETIDYRDETNEGADTDAVKKWQDKQKAALKELEKFKE